MYLACIWRVAAGGRDADSLHELRNSLSTAENITKVFERLVDIAFWVAMVVMLFFLLGNRCRRRRCRASHHMPPACLPVWAAVAVQLDGDVDSDGHVAGVPVVRCVLELLN